MRKLTPKQERFCLEYVIDFNATRAARDSGYSAKTAMEQGYQLLQIPSVRQKIEELKAEQDERLLITSDMIRARLWEIANVDPALAYDENGQLLPIHKIPEEVRRAIAGIDIYKDFTEGVEIGETKKLKFWNKNQALELLGKTRKLFTEKVEHSGKVTLEDLVAGSNEEKKDGEGNDNNRR